MAITNVEPAILGSFDPTGIVLQHDDTVTAAMWNRFVSNGATSYSMWRNAIANSRLMAFETGCYSCIPPTNVGVFLSGGLAEKAAVRLTVVWATVSGAGVDGVVRLMGGTSLSALGTLDEHTLDAASGTYPVNVATPVDLPGFAVSGGDMVASPYWLVVQTENPAATSMVMRDLHVRYSRYPVIT
jgi:hypothetical protein